MTNKPKIGILSPSGSDLLTLNTNIAISMINRMEDICELCELRDEYVKGFVTYENQCNTMALFQAIDCRLDQLSRIT